MFSVLVGWIPRALSLIPVIFNLKLDAGANLNNNIGLAVYYVSITELGDGAISVVSCENLETQSQESQPQSCP